MALDSVILSKVASELKQELIASYIDRINMPARDIVLLSFRTRNGPKKILISARSGMSRIHLTENEYENPAQPISFCMLLRKYLSGGRVKDISSVENERMIFMVFAVLDEKGDRVELKLSIEMMGRYSNIILINEQNRIIDALRHIDPEQSDKRRIFPGVEFTMPPVQNKLPFTTTETNLLIEEITKQPKPLSDAILSVVAGISPVVCYEISYAVNMWDVYADRLDDGHKILLRLKIDDTKKAAADKDTELYIIYDGGDPTEYSFIPLRHYLPLLMERFDSVSKMLDRYYTEREREGLRQLRSAGLKKQINTLLERVIRRQHSREEELNQTDKADRAKLYGELLTVNLHSLEKGMNSVTLFNYYDDNSVEIPLDAMRTPNQNAQRYYREYRKLTTAQSILVDLLEQGRQEIEYLKSVQYEVEMAVTEDEFLAIREELHHAGYLKAYKLKDKRSKRKTSDFLNYITSDGFKVLVGRNNSANERLTLRTAEKTDLWFHVKQGGGGHTVLLLENRTPTDLALTEAALIAAFNSIHKQGGQTAVDYTEIRHVKKAAGQRSGMVVYTNQKTIYVKPDKYTVDLLLEKPQQ